ncbi:MAG: phosphoenolpyruvate synthase, partial [bacterium]|nr:phosphoenolpyruvate synthase [bacterium]
NGAKEKGVPRFRRDRQKLSEDKIKELARILQKIHAHYYFPQDVEWAYRRGKFYIIQVRPITTLNSGKESDAIKANNALTTGEIILKGQSASPGIATGRVKIITSAKQIAKIKKGDILVAKMTSPDYVPAMKQASGIITDEGGVTSHAAIVSRELGIACVVGTGDATKILKDGMVVTVNGKEGIVIKGKASSKGVAVMQAEIKKDIPDIALKTATKIYVNLAEPDLAAEAAKLPVDGVGLLRAEFMIAEIGEHPKHLIAQRRQIEFVEKLEEKLVKFCEAFSPRPVVYRATDFKTNEYRHLSGGKAYEPEEPNPMLGYRGAYRYVADPDVFELEIAAIKRVRETYKNLWVMIPFVRSPEELLEVKKIMAASGLIRSATFKLWMMVELPVNVIRLEDFIKVGIDGVSVGSNDLTMLLLGTDRDNSEVATVFNERDPSVLWALERVMKICHKHKVTASICGQSVSTYDDLVEFLVKNGITSVSVNPDSVARVKRVVHEAEKRLAGVRFNV